MSFEIKSYPEITQSILEQLTKSIISESQVWEKGKMGYPLAASKDKVREVLKVEGVVGGARHRFKADVDYQLSDGSVVWLEDGARPDEKSTFYVSYLFGNPPPITDVNVGSVARTLIEAVSPEMEYFYEQMDYVYKSGFIDTASGNSLDLVVSILGVERKGAQRAQGTVTFGRKNPPTDSAAEQIVLYDGSESHSLRRTPVKEIVTAKGLFNKSPYEFKRGIDYELRDDSLAWLPSGQRPDYGTELRVSYKAYQSISVPEGTVVSTYSRRQQDTKTFETTASGTLARTAEGTWEVEVPVRAADAGPGGNVLSGSVTLMPQPVEGVEFVVNRSALTGGSEPENDDELRERSKAGLRALGRATYTALKQRIEEVDGVVRPVRIDELPVLYNVEFDGQQAQLPVPGVVRVIVDGGDMDAIRKVVDETRAAGVYVELVRPKLILFDINISVVLEPDSVQADVEPRIRQALDGYIGGVPTGEAVVFSRLIALIVESEGVKDVPDLAVEQYKDGVLVTTSTKENIQLKQDEKARIRNVSISVVGGQRVGEIQEDS